jgi:2',3'-cyclic-nucleotide 2'-phosphodiesterase (5'-nucleotidase family)
MFTSDLEGTLIDAPCAGLGQRPLLPQVAAVVSRERQRAASDGLQAPVLLDAGDALFPSPLVNELGGDAESANAIAQALRQAGYDALAMGDLSISAPTRSFLGLVRAAGTASVPMILSNIACGEDAEAQECQNGVLGASSNQAIITRGDLRIGVVNLLPQSLAGAMPRRTLAGAALTDVIEAARARVRALRSAGVDAVVLISQLDSPTTAPRHTLELIAGLEGADLPDVVLASSVAGMATRIQAPGNGPPVLTVSAGSIGRAQLRREDGRWTLVESSTEELPAEGDQALTATVTGWNGAYCRENAQPLAHAALTAELDQAAFAQLVLRALREQTHAEIAFINRRAVAGAAIFPLSGQLTASQVQRALPFPTDIRVATIRGVDIEALVGHLLDSDAVYSAGLERRDGVLYINGRQINPDGRYQVVTTSFVSRGGDGILSGEGVLAADADRWEDIPPRAEGVSQLDDRVIRWLDVERPATPYDPEQPLDLYRRPLWYGSLTLDAGLSYSSIRDDNRDDEGNRRYNQAQLNRQGVLDLRFAAEGRFGLNTRGHAWNNLIRLRYGRQRLETEVGSGEFEWAESADQIYFRSGYDMDYLRDVVLDGAWYGPTIFLEYQLESEFSHEQANADDDSRHFLEMTGLLGLRLKPNDWFRISAAGGIRSVVLAPDPYPVPGLNLRAEIIRTPFYISPTFPIHLAASIDYFVGWPVAIPDSGLNTPDEGSAIHKLTGEIRLELTLFGPLRLTGSVRGFLYDENPGNVALAFDTMLGLSVALSDHTQTF